MQLTAATLGIGAALVANASWVIGSIVFARLLRDGSPVGLNLGRGLFTVFYLGVVLWLSAGWTSLSADNLLRLVGSGLLGMALGDSLFFAALARLGPRLTLLLGMMGPVFSVLLGLLVLGERFDPLDAVGMVLTLTGVAGVLWRRYEPERTDERWLGVGLALGATLAMAVASLLAKVALVEVPPLQAAFVRMAASVAALSLVGLATGKLRAWLTPLYTGSGRWQLHFAIVVVVFGGFFLSMVALRLLPLSMAALVAASEPLMALLITWLALGQRVSRGEAASVLVGLVGVFLLVFQG
ncbi:MAG: DMT family transporter [Candidatus Eremiobacteraeota bacterium]|nr:DMT family transporter [Candidatus Eremiobacteraeota bacterium]